MSRGLGVTEALVDRLPAWAVDLFALVSMLGDLLLIVPALGLFYLADVWRRLRVGSGRGHGSDTATDTDTNGRSLCSERTVFVIATVFGGLAFVVALKAAFAVPRPPAAFHAVAASEYGFPSGHAMAATVFWGAIALWGTVGRRSTRLAVAATVVALVAVSRLALGVHYLVDVLASVVFGAGYLAVVAWVARGRPQRAFGVAIAMALVALALSGAGSRAALALVGTVGAASGWWLTERPVVRTRLRAVVDRSE